MNIEILPFDWDENNAKQNKPYKYSLFKTDLNIPGLMMGKSPCGCYAITVNPKADDFADRLFDFITYEKSHNRRVLIYSPDFDVQPILKNPSPCL